MTDRERQSQKTKKIVAIGGGTGTYTILSGLKRYPKDKVELSAVVSVSDSGGSTGRLRDEFGVLPVGDIRMALAALAEDGNGNDLLRELFLYRFDRGKGLSGHNFGNLFLVAMTDILKSEEKAIEYASKVLAVRGQVIPVSTEHVTLVAQFEDNSIVKSENAIDEPRNGRGGSQRIKKLWLEPRPQATSRALDVISEADLIVLGPGDLYTSILANAVVGGISEALATSKAKLVCVVNLMTKYGQTHDFSAADHIRELEKYIGRAPDHILVNKTPLPSDILDYYQEEKEFPVADDLSSGENVIRGDFLAPEEITKPSGDVLKRSLIRHDSDKLAKTLVKLL